MSRIPPGLLYLTIYNTALRADPNASSADEDAEEQAQILFYTARERAVSRDRMLRQVGLAKALINFSEMFNPEEGCSNVHSQARRMVMMSPEPNFWIHACLEVAKTPRSTPAKAKKNSKDKGKSKIASTREEVIFDYHDGSLHDISLRAHILHGYELFKLTHGSFTSVLSHLGQHALEMQLERYFTVWAWKWDVDEGIDFTSDLGMPVHPLSSNLTPALDDFAAQLEKDMVVFVIAPPTVVPSTRFRSARYPSCLLQHLISRIPPPPEPMSPSPESSGGQEQSMEKIPDMTENASTANEQKGTAGGQSAFLGLPSMNIPAMDMRNLKWNWPGYLTFSKNTPTKGTSPVPSTPPANPAILSPEQPGVDDETATAVEEAAEGKNGVVDLDAASLLEAMSTDDIHLSSPAAGLSPVLSATPLDEPPTQDKDTGARSSTAITAPVNGAASDRNDIGDPSQTYDEGLARPQSEGRVLPAVELTNAGASPEEPPPEEKEHLPDYLPTTVYLVDNVNTSDVQKKRMWHLTSKDLTLALVTAHDVVAGQLPSAENVVALLDAVRAIIVNEAEKAATDIPLPSATKILQPQNRHLVSVDGFTTSSTIPLSAKPEHLLNAQQILHSELDAVEVFSRGQNPQHWHIAKRGLDVVLEGQPSEGEVFMEIARKESSLTDVDNDLAGVVRRFLAP